MSEKNSKKKKEKKKDKNEGLVECDIHFGDKKKNDVSFYKAFDNITYIRIIRKRSSVNREYVVARNNSKDCRTFTMKENSKFPFSNKSFLVYCRYSTHEWSDYEQSSEKKSELCQHTSSFRIHISNEETAYDTKVTNTHGCIIRFGDAGLVHSFMDSVRFELSRKHADLEVECIHTIEGDEIHPDIIFSYELFYNLSENPLENVFHVKVNRISKKKQESLQVDISELSHRLHITSELFELSLPFVNHLRTERDFRMFIQQATSSMVSNPSLFRSMSKRILLRIQRRFALKNKNEESPFLNLQTPRNKKKKNKKSDNSTTTTVSLDFEYVFKKCKINEGLNDVIRKLKSSSNSHHGRLTREEFQQFLIRLTTSYLIEGEYKQVFDLIIRSGILNLTNNSTTDHILRPQFHSATASMLESSSSSKKKTNNTFEEIKELTRKRFKDEFLASYITLWKALKDVFRNYRNYSMNMCSSQMFGEDSNSNSYDFDSDDDDENPEKVEKKKKKKYENRYYNHFSKEEDSDVKKEICNVLMDSYKASSMFKRVGSQFFKDHEKRYENSHISFEDIIKYFEIAFYTIRIPKKTFFDGFEIVYFVMFISTVSLVHKELKKIVTDFDRPKKEENNPHHSFLPLPCPSTGEDVLPIDPFCISCPIVRARVYQILFDTFLKQTKLVGKFVIERSQKHIISPCQTFLELSRLCWCRGRLELSKEYLKMAMSKDSGQIRKIEITRYKIDMDLKMGEIGSGNIRTSSVFPFMLAMKGRTGSNFVKIGLVDPEKVISILMKKKKKKNQKQQQQKEEEEEDSSKFFRIVSFYCSELSIVVGYRDEVEYQQSKKKSKVDIVYYNFGQCISKNEEEEEKEGKKEDSYDMYDVDSTITTEDERNLKFLKERGEEIRRRKDKYYNDRDKRSLKSSLFSYLSRHRGRKGLKKENHDVEKGYDDENLLKILYSLPLVAFLEGDFSQVREWIIFLSDLEFITESYTFAKKVHNLYQVVANLIYFESLKLSMKKGYLYNNKQNIEKKTKKLYVLGDGQVLPWAHRTIQVAGLPHGLVPVFCEGLRIVHLMETAENCWKSCLLSRITRIIEDDDEPISMILMIGELDLRSRVLNMKMDTHDKLHFFFSDDYQVEILSEILIRFAIFVKQLHGSRIKTIWICPVFPMMNSLEECRVHTSSSSSQKFGRNKIRSFNNFLEKKLSEVDGKCVKFIGGGLDKFILDRKGLHLKKGFDLGCGGFVKPVDMLVKKFEASLNISL